MLVALTLDDEPQSGINQSVAMAIAGTSSFGVKTNGPEAYPIFQQVNAHFYKSFRIFSKFSCISYNLLSFSRIGNMA